MQKELSQRFRQVIYTLQCTLDPVKIGSKVHSTLPPNAFDSERVAKCRAIVESHVDPQTEESAALLWSDCKTLMKEPNEPRVVIACFLVAKLIESQNAPPALIAEFLESLLVGSTWLTRPSYIDFVADLFHTIILRFSDGFFGIIEKQNSSLIRELFSGREVTAAHRYLAYSFLNQIMSLKQYLVWKELKNFDARTVFATVASETPYCQSVATTFLTDMMRFISKLDKEEQKHYFSNFVMTLLMQSKEQKSDKFFRLFHFTYRYIFGDLNKSFFSRDQLGQVFDTSIENIRQSLARNDPEISRLACDMIPEMIEYQPALFVERKLLEVLLNILYEELQRLGTELTAPTKRILGVVRKVFRTYSADQTSPQAEKFAMKIVDLLSDYWQTNPGVNANQGDVLNCFEEAVKNVKDLAVLPEEKLQNFISYLLIYHFDETALPILEALDQHPNSQFCVLLERKLKYTTASILKKEMKDFEDVELNDDLFSERLSKADFDADFETTSFDNHRYLGSPQSFKETFRMMDGDTKSVKNLDDPLKELQMSKLSRGTHIQKQLRRAPQDFALEKRLVKRSHDFGQFCHMLGKRLEILDMSDDGHNATAQERRIAVALDALARFEFQSKFNNRRKNLIKDAVFDYLESDSIELRRKAGRIVFLLIADQQGASTEDVLSDTSLQGIIKKIMSIAIGDPDAQVRVEILTSLNTQMRPLFIPFILSEDNLKTLIVMLSDTNHKVQEQAVLLLEKLIPSFPELLARFDQIVFVSSSYLVTNRDPYSVKALSNVRQLGVIARYSQFLLKNRLPVIIAIMVQTLQDCMAQVSLAPQSTFHIELLCASLDTLGHLVNYQPDLARDHFRKLVSTLVPNLSKFDEDLLYSSISFLIILTRNSGLQLLLAIEYNIFFVLLDLLEKGGSQRVRTNILRFMGTVGALDPGIIRAIKDTVLKNIPRGYTPRQVFPRVMDKLRKSPLNFEKYFPYESNMAALPLYQQYDAFVNEAYLVQKDSEAVMHRYLHSPDPSEADGSSQQKLPVLKKSLKLKPYQEKDGAENFNKKIQNEDYLLRFVIHQTLAVLFDVILNQTDEKLVVECLESLQQIILTLGRHVYDFKRVIFFRLIQAFKAFHPERGSKTRVLIVQNIKYFAKASSFELASDPKCVSKLSKLLLDNLGDLELQGDLLVICKLLVHNKTMLQHRFKDIVLELLKMLRQSTTPETIDSIFDIIIILNHNDYYYLITPALLEFFPNQGPGPRRQRPLDLLIFANTLKYMRGILKTKHFENYFGNILRALTGLIESVPAMREAVTGFLLEVFQMSGERCFNYLPLINPYLRNVEEYQKILRTLNEKGYIEVNSPPAPVDFEAAEEADPDTGDSDHTLKGHSLRKGNYDAIKNYFLINNFNKSDFNWNDWFNHLKNELFLSSHSTVLIACKNLLLHKQIIDRLFKPAFVLFWSQLNDHQKSQITRGFDSIISNASKIQVTIRKKILELVEFMSHPNEFGMVLNITKLADFAINCHNPSKAIFFKEMEFQMNPLNATEALLNLYLEVGHRYAAEGLLDYVQNTLGLKVEEKWLQMLGKWDLMAETPAVETRDSSAMQVYGSIATSNWESAFHKIKEILGAAGGKGVDPQISTYMAKAALHLSKWDVIKKYAGEVASERDFYKAVAAFTDAEPDYEASLEHLAEEIRALDKSLQNYSNYTYNYEKWVRLQKYVELEAANLTRLHFDELAANELYNFIVPKPQQDEERRVYERQMLEVWEDQLMCMERSIDHWQEILATRNVFFSKNRMLSSYLRFSSLCYYTDNSQLFTRILTALKKEIPANMVPDDALEVAEIECNYKTGRIQQKQAISKIEELVARRTMPKDKIPLFYKKMGPWIISSEIKNDGKDEKLIKFFERFLSDQKAKDDPRLWHYFAVANYQMIKDIGKHKADPNLKYVLNAMTGFTNSVVHETKFNSKHTMQDLLKLLKLWYDYHDFKGEKVAETIERCTQQIPNRNWLLILRQVIARLEQNPTFSASVKNLLVSLAKEFPQYLVFPLLLARKSKDGAKARMITRLLGSPDVINKTLVQEATIFSDQLIRISILLDEIWLQSYPEAAKYKDQNKIDSVISVLNGLFDITSARKGRSSLDEIAFFQKFGGDTKQAREFLDLYETSKNELFFIQAWSIYTSIVAELEGLLKKENDVIHLETVSPELFNMKNSVVCVPGTLKRNPAKQKDIRIIQVKTVLRVLKSKRRPRKLSLFGSDGKEYSFLLKGKEDLRLDERVMQLLTIINDLLKPSISESNQALKITTYNVLPLSYDCGIISWLEGWDTVYDAIKDYRSKIKVTMDCERDLWREFHDNYNVLSKVKKLEVYTYICANTKCEDLKNIFWLRSPTADVWLLSRSNYICSVAVMSMVGYILGLGDRHLMNIMLEKSTGKIVHIDFGECFESEQKRERLPEKVPFRLTLVMVKAMEACGVEGTFKRVCETVMNILRLNKDVILSFFEEFVVDPLMTWKTTDKKSPIGADGDIGDDPHSYNLDDSKVHDQSFITEKHSIPVEPLRKDTPNPYDEMMNKSRNKDPGFNALTNDINLNPRAKAALNTIVNKLNGRDFESVESDFKVQVKRLIKQATNPENISQAYTGWNPFL